VGCSLDAGGPTTPPWHNEADTSGTNSGTDVVENDTTQKPVVISCVTDADCADYPVVDDCLVAGCDSSTGLCAAVEGEEECFVGVSCTGDYMVTSEDDLLDLAGCSEITGKLVILNSDDIVDLTLVAKLKAIGGDLIIRDNQSLASLYGMEKLKSIGGQMVVAMNPALGVVEGLGALETVAGNLMVRLNPVLTTISGLDNVYSVGEHLVIEDNEVLT